MSASRVLFATAVLLGLMTAGAAAQSQMRVTLSVVGTDTYIDSLFIYTGGMIPQVNTYREFGGGYGVYTRDVDITRWPMRIQVHWRLRDAGQTPMDINNPENDEWYHFPSPANSRVKFNQLGAVEEPGALPAPARVTAAPNPFSHRTRLTAQLARPGRTVVGVYDAAGRPVRSLADGSFEPGTYHWVWDGTDDGGNRLAPGIYFARLATAGEKVIHKLILTD